MNTISIPVWERFLQATPELAFVELDLAAQGDPILAIESVAASTREVVFSVRSSAEEVLWLPKALGRAAEALEHAISLARKTGFLPAICPSAIGFPSDIPSTLSFLRAHQSEKLGLVIEPAALMTEPLVKFAREHFGRMTDALFPCQHLKGVVLSNIRWTQGKPIRTGLADGAIPPLELERIAASIPESAWVIQTSSLAAQS